MLSACSNIMEDASYDPSVEKCRVVTDLAASVKKLCLHQTSEADTFCQWLALVLGDVVTKATKNVKKVSTLKERVCGWGCGYCP